MQTVHSLKSGSLVLLFALFLAGCSSPNESKPPSDVIEKEPYAVQTYTVEIKDMAFQPADLTVHSGDTVIWINKDIVAHDVTETNKAWASPTLASDASWKKVITSSESYYCSIHLVMKGDITVEE